jgi:hypothetical protein
MIPLGATLKVIGADRALVERRRQSGALAARPTACRYRNIAALAAQLAAETSGATRGLPLSGLLR